MTEEIVLAEERHIVRTVIRLAILIGLLYVAARFLAQKRDEFANLTESEARARFVDKVGPRMGDDTANEIADQVIPKLKDRGLLKPDVAEAGSDRAGDGSGAAGGDAVSETVDSVVED